MAIGLNCGCCHRVWDCFVVVVGVMNRLEGLVADQERRTKELGPAATMSWCVETWEKRMFSKA